MRSSIKLYRELFPQAPAFRVVSSPCCPEDHHDADVARVSSHGGDVTANDGGDVTANDVDVGVETPIYDFGQPSHSDDTHHGDMIHLRNNSTPRLQESS